MTPRLHNPTTVFAVMLGIALATPAALAHTQPAPPKQASGQTTATKPDTGAPPSQAELKHFAAAAVQVQKIRQTLQPKLAATKDAGTRDTLKQAAEKQMEAAVRGNQLSLHRYIQIADAVQTNSTLRSEVQRLMPPRPAASKS